MARILKLTALVLVLATLAGAGAAWTQPPPAPAAANAGSGAPMGSGPGQPPGGLCPQYIGGSFPVRPPVLLLLWGLLVPRQIHVGTLAAGAPSAPVHPEAPPARVQIPPTLVKGG